MDAKPYNTRCHLHPWKNCESVQDHAIHINSLQNRLTTENHIQHRCTITHWHCQHHHTQTDMHIKTWALPTGYSEIHLEARKQQDTSDGKMHTHTAAQRFTKTHKHWLEKHTVSHWLICPTFPRMLADLGWGSFFSCISLYHTLTAAVNSTWQSKPPSLSSHTQYPEISLTPSHPQQEIQRLNPQASMPAVLSAAVPHSPLYT